MAVGGGPGHAKCGGRIVDRQPGEVPQFDHLGGDRILGGQPGQGRIQGEQFVVSHLGFDGNIGQIDSAMVSAMLLSLFSAGGVHQDAAHGLGGSRKEVPAAVERLVADQPQVRLVNEGGSIEGLARGFGRPARGGEFPQLVVHEREQIVGSLAVSLLGSL